MPESQIAQSSRIHNHLFSGVVLYIFLIVQSEGQRLDLSDWYLSKSNISGRTRDSERHSYYTMPREVTGERQPLLERIGEGSFKSSDHWNLAGLSQKHFWVLVGSSPGEKVWILMYS